MIIEKIIITKVTFLIEKWNEFEKFLLKGQLNLMTRFSSFSSKLSVAGGRILFFIFYFFILLCNDTRHKRNWHLEYLSFIFLRKYYDYVKMKFIPDVDTKNPEIIVLKNKKIWGTGFSRSRRGMKIYKLFLIGLIWRLYCNFKIPQNYQSEDHI